MTVDFWGFGENGENAKLGTVEFTGGKLVVTPPNDLAMNKVIRSSALDTKTGGKIDAKDDPEKWLKSLKYTYRSPYFQAGEAK